MINGIVYKPTCIHKAISKPILSKVLFLNPKREKVPYPDDMADQIHDAIMSGRAEIDSLKVSFGIDLSTMKQTNGADIIFETP